MADPDIRQVRKSMILSADSGSWGGDGRREPQTGRNASLDVTLLRFGEKSVGGVLGGNRPDEGAEENEKSLVSLLGP